MFINLKSNKIQTEYNIYFINNSTSGDNLWFLPIINFFYAPPWVIILMVLLCT